jgi:hypothetical protein
VTASLQLGGLAWLDVVGFAVLAIAGAAVAVWLARRHAGASALCGALGVVALFYGVGVAAPRALGATAVAIDVDGVWCAPWADAVAWRDVRAVSERFEKLDDRGWRPTHLVFQLAPDGPAHPAPVGWERVEPGWLRPLLWVTRRTPSLIAETVEQPARFCGTEDLDVPHETLDRLAKDLMRAEARPPPR